MAYNLMIDNNVVLDKFLRREPFFEESNLVCLLGAIGDTKNFVSVTMLTDIFYSLSKAAGHDVAHDILIDSLEFLNFCNVTAEDGAHCLYQRWDDFEDCLVARCAENINADYIITRNKKDFVNSAIPAISPAELFDLLDKQEGLTYHKIDLTEYND